MAGLLGSGANGGARLAERFRDGEMVLAPGCYDPLGALLIEEAGFPAVYMTGFGTSAGVAAIHLEDHVMPKRCGHMEGKQLIGAAEIEHIAAAFPDTPLLFNYADGGKTPAVSQPLPARPGVPPRHLPAEHAPDGDRDSPRSSTSSARPRSGSWNSVLPIKPPT